MRAEKELRLELLSCEYSLKHKIKDIAQLEGFLEDKQTIIDYQEKASMKKDAEIERLKNDNEKLKKCVEYYAAKETWKSNGNSRYDFTNDKHYFFISEVRDTEIDCLSTEKNESCTIINFYGGKLARQTLKELGERDE